MKPRPSRPTSSPSPSSYTTTAKLLHWLMALLILGMISLGLYMQGLPFSPEKLKLISWHKWAGICVLLLVTVRLGWRLTHPPPPLPAHMPRVLRMAAHTGHALLYVLMFVIPLSGWLMSSAKGVPTVWFGLWPLPDLLAPNESLGNALQVTHKYLNWFLMAVIGGHVAAAFKHHLIDRDDILVRMLPTLNRENQK